MKIALMPDFAMFIVNLINKSGHEYLSASSVSQSDLEKREVKEGDEKNFDYEKPPFNMGGYNLLESMKFLPAEAPSGVMGRLTLFENVIREAEAAIILDYPRNQTGATGMYDKLNELILFSCISCPNSYDLIVHILKEKKIPRLEISYPECRDDLISIIDDVNEFLENVEDMPMGTVVDRRKYHYDDRVSLDVIEDEINKITKA